MGAAENWQDRLAKALSDTNATLLNPRRDDWDDSWKQDPTPGTQFHEQVKWEMDAQDISDIIVYYFDPNTKAPITLLEMGTYGTDPKKNIIVCCPDEFYRKGNVTMFCNRYNVLLVDTFDEMVDNIRKALGSGK